MDKDLKGEFMCQDLNDKFVMGLSISHLCCSMKMLLQYFYTGKSDRALFVK